MSEPEGVVGHSVCSGHSWSGKSGRSLITRIALSRSPVTTPTANPVSFLLFFLHTISHAPFPFLFLLAPGSEGIKGLDLDRSFGFSLLLFIHCCRVVGCLLLYPAYSFISLPSSIYFPFMIRSSFITSQKKDASISRWECLHLKMGMGRPGPGLEPGPYGFRAKL